MTADEQPQKPADPRPRRRRVLLVCVVAAAGVLLAAGIGSHIGSRAVSSQQLDAQQLCQVRTGDVQFVIIQRDWDTAWQRARQQQRAISRAAGEDEASIDSVRLSIDSAHQKAFAELVAEQLWVAAGRQAGITVTDQQVNTGWRTQLADVFASDQQLRSEVLSLQGYSEQAWKERMRSRMYFSRLGWTRDEGQAALVRAKVTCRPLRGTGDVLRFVPESASVPTPNTY